MTSRELKSAPGRPVAKVNVCLESRYRKLERGLPQTVFYCPDCKGHRRRRKACARCAGYGKLTRDSVQELVARQLLPAFRARAGKFHGAGREDVDVRMLGRGRPFVFEVVGARVLDVDLADVRRRIDESSRGRIEVEPFVRVPRARIPELKEAKLDKVYRAEVAVEAPVAESMLVPLARKAVDVVQRTPPRVAHRRADLDRERRVAFVGIARPAADRLTVDVRCSHGTYVKEWISGDEGRTRPSLADLLGVPCRCVALDVLEIVIDEPASGVAGAT